MSAMWIIYLGELFGSLKVIGFIICAAVPPFVVIASAIQAEGYNNETTFKGHASVWIKMFRIPFSLAFLCLVFAPSTTTLYLMAGAKVTQEISTSPEAREIGSKIFKILNEKLDEKLTEKKK